MDVAVVSLGDHVADPASGVLSSQHDKFRLLVEQAVWAEEAGFAAMMLGEHHFCGYILSVPQILLAAIAERTTTLRLNTGVTLLPTQDPVRIPRISPRSTSSAAAGWRSPSGGDPRFDLRRHGRADRGLTPGVRRAPRAAPAPARRRGRDMGGPVPLPPRAHHRPAPTVPAAEVPSVGRGGMSSASIDLAARSGTWLMLPGVFGTAETFLPFAQRYREQWVAAGHGEGAMRVGNVYHCHVAATSQAARARWEPHYSGLPRLRRQPLGR